MTKWMIMQTDEYGEYFFTGPFDSWEDAATVLTRNNLANAEIYRVHHPKSVLGMEY